MSIAAVSGVVSAVPAVASAREAAATAAWRLDDLAFRMMLRSEDPAVVAGAQAALSARAVSGGGGNDPLLSAPELDGPGTYEGLLPMPLAMLATGGAAASARSQVLPLVPGGLRPLVADFAPAAAVPVPVEEARGAPAEARRVLELVNAERTKRGLSPLRLDARLVRNAQAHSRQMAQVMEMAHEGIGDGSPGDRIRKALPGASRTAENVAAGQESAEQVVRDWLRSPGHRRNILDPNLRTMGLAVATGDDDRRYWTQVFAG